MDKMSKEKPLSSTILPSPSGWLSNKPQDDKAFPATNLRSAVFPAPVKTRAQFIIAEQFSGSLELVPMEIDSEDDKGWLSNKPQDDKAFPATNLRSAVFPAPVKTRAQFIIAEQFSGSLELVPMEIDSEDDKGWLSNKPQDDKAFPATNLRSAESKQELNSEEPMEVDAKLPIEMEIASCKMNRQAQQLGACGGASDRGLQAELDGWERERKWLRKALPRRKNYQSKEEVRKLKDLSSSSTSKEDHG